MAKLGTYVLHMNPAVNHMCSCTKNWFGNQSWRLITSGQRIRRLIDQLKLLVHDNSIIYAAIPILLCHIYHLFLIFVQWFYYLVHIYVSMYMYMLT